jgi:hypothetical protein
VSRRSVTSVATLMLVVFLGLVPAASAGSGGMVLASGDDGRTLKLGDLASDDDLIGVVFQKQDRSYLRWSNDYGDTFAPRVPLRGGLRAREPRVAVCNDMVFAVSAWPTSGSRNVGIDYRDIVTGESWRYSLGAGHTPDVACFGEVVAATWVHEDHAWLAIHEGPCESPCSPAVKMDLGASTFGSPPRITSDYEGFTAAWVSNGLAIQHFEFTGDGAGNLNVTADPVLKLMAGKDVSTPEIAALGQRMVVAYTRAGQTHLRTSDDVATSFGPRIIVSRYCRDCPEGGSHPQSVAVRGHLILVEVTRVAGVPPGYEGVAFLSRDGGASWEKRSTGWGGSQRGVLLSHSLFAEAWDTHYYNGDPYSQLDQVIGFRVGDL